MSNLPSKVVFLDEQAIGHARTIGEAVAVLRRYATKRHPTAALRALLTDLGVERPQRWDARQHIVEGPDEFHFYARMLP